MMSLGQKDIKQAFLDLMPLGQRSGSGWRNCDCPLCGDTRKRLGILETPTGGWRATCFNAGCLLADKPTGWEPGNGLGGRPRILFEALGGDIRDIDLKILFQSASSYDRRGNKIGDGKSAVTSFPRCDLPDGAIRLRDGMEDGLDDDRFVGVLEYLRSRGAELLDAWDYRWSPEHPNHLIIPYFHHGMIVGWLGRKVLPGKDRFIGHSPSDYIFRQDSVESKTGRSVIVSEGVMDAISMDGMAVRSSRMTELQRLFLEICGRRVIILPDFTKDGMALIDAAEANGWDVSVPDWDRGIKDATAAASRYGRLYTIESIVAGAGKNYLKARTKAQLGG